MLNEVITKQASVGAFFSAELSPDKLSQDEEMQVAWRQRLVEIKNTKFCDIDGYIAALAFASAAFFYHRRGLLHVEKIVMDQVSSHLEQAHFVKENTVCELLLPFMRGEKMDEVGFSVSYFLSKHPALDSSFTPSIEYLFLLSSVLGILGVQEGLVQLYSRGHQLAKVLLKIVKKPSKALYSSWNLCSKGSFAHLDHFATLLGVWYGLKKQEAAEKVLHELMEKIEQKEQEITEPFMLCLLLASHHAGALKSFIDDVYLGEMDPIDQELGFCFTEHGPFEGALFTKGAGISLGFLRKGDVEISAMGPLKGQLDTLEGFGFYQKTPLLPRDFTLWSKCLTAHGELASDSEDLFFSMKGISDEKVVLRTYLKPAGDEQALEKLFFAFFLNADHLVVDGALEVRKQEIKGFSGHVSELTLVGEKTMKWSFSQRMFIHIAPLPCKNFFWEAAFLVAYQLEGVERNFQIEIV